jgi:phosphate:Na+ symporter
VGNLITRVVGVVAVLAALPHIAPRLVRLDPDNARAVADFHTVFNVAVAAVFFPLLPIYARLLERLLPARINLADPSRPRYLDEAASGTPFVALAGAAREALRLADVLGEMLLGARDAFETGERRRIAETRRLDHVIDRLSAAIKAYLSGLDPEALGQDDRRRMGEILVFVTNIEHAGDVVERNLLDHAAKLAKRGLSLAADEHATLRGLLDRLGANLRTAGSLFMTPDGRIARRLAEEKEAFRAAETAATTAQFERLRAGRADLDEAGALMVDTVRDIIRVNTHLVAASAYPVLESQGELLPSRLRQDE